ncbi:DUF4411 family protein [Leifsonia aquatica]|uniref:DUF4411 family protein n=1 Tax=Leifsonia aquatica TaxID=144185 RepID=UPI003822C21E
MDASSLVQIREHFNHKESEVAAALERIHALINAGQAGFPSCVVKNCKEFVPETYLAAWVLAVSGSVAVRDVPYEHQVSAVNRVPDLTDPDDQDDSALQVVAYALSFQQPGVTVVVVSEEQGTHPTRQSLSEACAALSIECISMEEMLARI